MGRRHGGTGAGAILIGAHRLCRDLLRVYLKDAFGVEVVAEADHIEGREWRDAVRRADLAICCLDDAKGLERVARVWARAAPPVPLIGVMWGHGSPPAPPGLEDEAVFIVGYGEGLGALGTAVARTLSGGKLRRAAARGVRSARLTERQLEVVDRVASGWTNRRIGSALGLSPRTIERHRLNAMKRLGVRTTAELVREAARLRLIDLGEGGREPPER